MKHRFFNYTLVFVLLCGFVYKAGAQNIQVEAKLKQYTIRIGDQTKLFLSVHQPAKQHVDFPKLADTLVSKVQIVNVGKADTTTDKSDPGNITVIQSYTITSFDAGTYTIPPFSVGTPGGVLKTNELTLQVETVKVDTTKAIYDIKQPLAVSYTFLDWLKDNWLWVALGVVVVLGIIGLIWYLTKRPKKEVVVEAVEQPGLPPHVIAINKLKELRERKLWQEGEIKQYYIELSDILREYLEKRYVIKTHEKTTDEIFDSLKRISITAENRKILKDILVLSDLVKFAKEKPLPPENEQCMDNAIRFVSATQQDELPKNKEGVKADV
jgi:hypothetical protein